MTATRGFTLLELLVVLVLVALVLALVPPMLSKGVPEVELRAAVRSLAAGMSEARSRAIARNTEVAFTVDVEARTFAIGDGGAARAVARELSLSLVTAQSDQLAETRGSIRFFPDGSSTGGRITLSRGESSYDVSVDWLTGRVSLRD